MKFLVILFAYIAFGSAVVQDTYKLPEDKIAKLQTVGNTCASETNVDPGVFSKLASGMLPRDEAHNKFAYCFGTKNGILDEAGHIIVAKMANLLGDHPRVSEFKEAITKCNDVTKENPFETVAEMYDCYLKNTPVRFEF